MSEKEYIERGALLKELECENAVKYGNKNAEQRHNSYSTMMMYEIADTIYDAPAADVEPVVRAKWEPVDTADGYVEYRCSNCGIRGQERYARCSCGAHMERSGDK